MTARLHHDGQASAVSLDGTRLAVTHEHWTLTLRDVASGTDKVIFEILDSPMEPPTFSPDSSRVVSVVNDRSIYIWNTTTRHLLGQFQTNGASIQSLALSPDGTRIVSICGSSSETIVQMWHVTDNPRYWYLNTCGDLPESAAFFSDGVHFITMSESGAQLWDIQSTIPLRVFKSNLPCELGTDIAISSDNTRLISDSCLWNLNMPNCQVLKSFMTSTSSAAKFSPDGTRAAINLNNTVQILDATSGATLCELGDITYFGGISFLLDSTQLLHWTYDDGIVRVMDLTGLPTSVNSTEVLSCVYPPDCMMIQSFQGDGWYRTTNGARLMWLPQDMQPVWLATGGGPSGSRRLILGSINGLVILDMEDYLEVPSISAAWRKGGVRYMDDIDQASILMSETRSAVWVSCLFVLFIPC